MSKTIPNKVREVAANEGCNHVEFVGTIVVGTIEGNTRSHDVFSISEVDENGLPIPTGLPVLILWDGEEVEEVVTGARSLKLLSRFD
mgnify:CR=1 FL=1